MLTLILIAFAVGCGSDHDFGRLAAVESRVAQLEQRLAAIEHQFDLVVTVPSSPKPIRPPVARIEPTIEVIEIPAGEPVWSTTSSYGSSSVCTGPSCRVRSQPTFVPRRWRRR